MKRVVALDPGGTTGWASLTVVGGEDMWEEGQIGPDAHHFELWDFLKEESVLHHDMTIVCESFEFRQNKQRNNINLMSREYIGVIRLFGVLFDIPVVFQTAGTGKGFVSDDKLKVMGLYKPGQRHSNDAKRHLIYYVVTKLHRTDLLESWKSL